MKVFPTHFICKIIYRNNIILAPGQEQKAGTTIGEVHGHKKPSLCIWNRKTAKILPQLPCSTPINQIQLVKHIPIWERLQRSGLRRKVTGTHPSLKPKVFSHSPHIQRATWPSQKSQIPSLQRVIQSTSVERNWSKFSRRST